MDLDLTNEKRILSRAAQRQNPVNGSLELLPLCNMNCEMCYIRLHKKEVEEQGGLHDVEEWIQLGNEMAEAGVLFLLLTGGEPLMFPGFKRLYQELKRLGMILTINTNGTLLDRGWADFFAAHKPRRINITLYGADDAAFACAVGADERDHAASGNGQGHALDGVNAAVMHMKIVNLQHCLHPRRGRLR